MGREIHFGSRDSMEA